MHRLTMSSEGETAGCSVAAALKTPSWPTTMSGSASDPTRIRSRMEERDLPDPCTTGPGERSTSAAGGSVWRQMGTPYAKVLVDKAFVEVNELRQQKGGETT